MANNLLAVAIVKINGASAFGNGVAELRLSRTLGTAAHLQLRFDSDHADAVKAVVGATLELSVQPADTAKQPTAVFSGEIVGIGIELRVSRYEIVVDAYDAAYKLMRRAPIATHLQKNPGDILRTVLGAAGVSADVSAFPSPVFPTFHTWGSTARCVEELCARIGAEWYVDGSKFVVRPRPASPTSTGVKLRGSETLRSFSARFTAAEQAKEIAVRGWNVTEKRAITGKHTGTIKPPGQHPSIVADHLQGNEPATAWSPFTRSDGDAGAIAKHVAGGFGMAVLTGRGECDVEPRLVPGATLEIADVEPKWNGHYYLTAVEHVITPDQPFVTRFTVGGRDAGTLVDLLGEPSRPSWGQLVSGLTIGIVTNNKDPDKLDRVKLKFPQLSETDESEWARVVAPGAGAKRGLLALPEVNDEVLVGFEHGDIHRPYVLGGLWNGKDLPPLHTDQEELLKTNKVASRSFTSRLGHKLTLADDGPNGELVKLELGTKKVELTLSKDDGIMLKHEGDVPLEISTGKASIKFAANGDITITGNKLTIDATAAVAVNGATIAAKSKGTLDLEGQGPLTAKGSMVSIEAQAMTAIKGMPVKVN